MSTDRSRLLRSIDRASARDRLLIAARGGGAGMSVGAAKVRALLDAVAVLEAAEAPYALIGGVAVGLHAGIPRATLDTDLAVLSSKRGV